MAKKTIHTVYDNMDFPDYEYREYPKHVPDPKNPEKYLVVNDAEEERAATNGAPLEDAERERTRLLKLAEVKKVDIDGRWSDKRIRDALLAAGVDLTLNPYE